MAAFTHWVGGKLAPIIRGYDSTSHAYATLDSASKLIQLATTLQFTEESQTTTRALNTIRKIQGNAGVVRAAKVLIPALGTYG